MSKYYGRIGFIETVKTSPGVYEEKIDYRYYKGDVLKNFYRWDSGNNLNDNININNTISILADSFLYEHLGYIRCIEWMGFLWEINSADVQRPRLILSIGGVYNGESIGTSEDSGADDWE